MAAKHKASANTGTVDDSGVRSFSSIVLIFPKVFEMSQFLKVAAAKFVVTREEFRGLTCYKLMVDIEGSTCQPFVVSLGESDIGFTFRLQKLMQSLNRASDNMYYILCGTCGGSFRSGHHLEDTFQITKAVKFDRGELGLENGAMVFKSNKVVTAECSNPTAVLNPTTALCSNYIMSFDPVDLATLFATDNANVADMETFEFFSVCKSNGVHSYDCLRIVSDITETGKSYSSEEKATIRSKRKGVGMGNLLNKVITLLYMGRTMTCGDGNISLQPSSLHDYATICDGLNVPAIKDLTVESASKKRKAKTDEPEYQGLHQVVSKKISEFRGSPQAGSRAD